MQERDILSYIYIENLKLKISYWKYLRPSAVNMLSNSVWFSGWNRFKNILCLIALFKYFKNKYSKRWYEAKLLSARLKTKFQSYSGSFELILQFTKLALTLQRVLVPWCTVTNASKSAFTISSRLQLSFR